MFAELTNGTRTRLQPRESESGHLQRLGQPDGWVFAHATSRIGF